MNELFPLPPVQEDLPRDGGIACGDKVARTVRLLNGDVFACLARIPDNSIDCVVTSPPYWGLRDYGVEGQLGLERTLGEHLDVMVRVFREVRRVLKPSGTLWLNYGDCYATSPNGRSAADTKAAGNDDRTFRDKPFSTVGAIYAPQHEKGDRRGGDCKQRTHDTGKKQHRGRIVAPHGKRITANSERSDVDVGGWGASDDSIRWRGGGFLKPKDLCMVPNRLAIALQEDGWWVRSEIVWGKPNAMPDSSGRYRPATAHEKIFMLTKTGKAFYDPAAVRVAAVTDLETQKAPDNWDTAPGAHGNFHRAGREKGKRTDKQRGHSRRHAGFNDRWDAMPRAEQQQNGRLLRNYEPAPIEVMRMACAAFPGAHFATFPPELVERCLKAGCPKGGMVLDPFGGSGTTALVADGLGMDSVLIELNPADIEIARKRLSDMFRLVDVEVVA